MPLKEARGNMYGFVTHTKGYLKGPCLHGCTYCCIRKMVERYGKTQGLLWFDMKELKENLGRGKIIFICYNNDLFAEEIPADWIALVLDHCRKYPENTYLFQSKNPARMLALGLGQWKNAILATTVETDREDYVTRWKITQAPAPLERLSVLMKAQTMGKKLVTIEPVMDFTTSFVDRLIAHHPDMVAIGADSKRCNLVEPEPWEIKSLAEDLRMVGIKVFIKGNLKRLVKDYEEGWL